jgi:hypothetical protein
MEDWAIPYSHDFIQCNEPSSTPIVIETINNYVQTQRELRGNPNWNIDGICSFDEYSIVCANEVCAHFGFPGIPPETVSKIKHKQRLRIESKNAGIYVPRSRMLPIEPFLRGDYYNELTTEWTFPVVLKPVAGASSTFVRKINSYDELSINIQEYNLESIRTGASQHWNVGSNNNNNEHGPTPTETEAPFMIEEFLYGQEVDIDLVVERGVIKFIGVADNFPSAGNPNLFMESGGCQPSQLPLTAQDELIKMTQLLVSHFGTDLSGVFHFEAKYTPNGPSPIEMNLRLGGCEVLTFILAVYGVNLGLQQLKLACNIPIEDLNTTPHRTCCSTNILAVESGYVQDVGFNYDYLDENPYFMGGMHRCYIGQALKCPPLGFSFCAWMVTSGDNYIQAKSNVNIAANGFFIHFKPYNRNDINGKIGGVPEGQYYLEHSERQHWSLIRQIGHDLFTHEESIEKIQTEVIEEFDTPVESTTIVFEA